jgi:formate--tetrahydrofolate ligase
VIATSYAKRIADYVVTEAGFGADLGMEKFMDIKTRVLGVMPSAVILVVSIRALKFHGGATKENIKVENLDALKKGMENLEKHIENISFYHVPFVLAVNEFASDSLQEVKFLTDWAKTNQIPLEVSRVFAKGSEGGIDIAKRVLSLIPETPDPACKPLYDVTEPIKTKIERIATKLYGAKGVAYSEIAEQQIADYNRLGWDKLPICMAKTPLSLSDNPKLLGRPKGFIVTIREFKPSLGAGFLVALTGEVMTMPGLPKIGAYENMDVINGEIVGLF